MWMTGHIWAKYVGRTGLMWAKYPNMCMTISKVGLLGWIIFLCSPKYKNVVGNSWSPRVAHSLNDFSSEDAAAPRHVQEEESEKD